MKWLRAFRVQVRSVHCSARQGALQGSELPPDGSGLLKYQVHIDSKIDTCDC